ncbi:hypothetical protein [Microcoleus sp. FACHB-831]|uniref:hypothetical protein n=1 Tax=Microcoleus sp. FACHB-831 TaxID=2692827 RepID=UPI0018EFC8FB|nr:hypothetical protein [Microcoleus sp. FACHB-831]
MSDEEPKQQEPVNPTPPLASGGQESGQPQPVNPIPPLASGGQESGQPQPVNPTIRQQIPPTPPLPKGGASGTTINKVTTTLQQTWVKVQPVVKAQTIKALRGTIGLLEVTVEKLEASPPPISTIESSATTGAIAPADALPTQPAVSTTPAPSLSQRFSAFWARLQIWWKFALEKIRSILPGSVNQKLSDTALSGAIAGVLLLVLWTTSALVPDKPTQVAQVPPPQIDTPEVAPPDASTPEVAPPDASTPEVTLPDTQTPEVTPSPIDTPKVPPTGIDTPPELTAPEQPEPVKIGPPVTTDLTPEQNLIAAIQNQVSEITSEYAEGLIQAIQANFQGSLLSVKVNNAWYNLSLAQQDSLASEMLQRSQELDFSKLEITDSQGTLLARSPVVGSNMIILKRSLLAAS